MKKRLSALLLICVFLLSAISQTVVFAEPLYTDMTDGLKTSERVNIGAYLTRFGACYTAKDSSSSTHRYIFDGDWTTEMSKIIWWQFLAYSQRDLISSNAAINGSEKTVTQDDVSRAVYTTFAREGIPDNLYETSDSYYIANIGGAWHAPQQNPREKMWTRSPENCRIQFFGQLSDGNYIVQYTLEYLDSALGTYDNTTYYAILKRADTRYGFVAKELGTTSALPEEYKNAGFLEDAKRGARITSNVAFDYSVVESANDTESFASYLKERLGSANEAPNGPAVTEISRYIETAISRICVAKVTCKDNEIRLPADIDALTEKASDVSDTLWGIAKEYGAEADRVISLPVQVVAEGLDDKSLPHIKVEEKLINALPENGRIDILLGDNNHRVTLLQKPCKVLCDSYGDFSIQYAREKRSGYVVMIYNENGNVIDKFSAPLTVAFPTDNKYDTVWYKHANGKEYNIGGRYDEANQAIEVTTKFGGRFRVANNEQNIGDIKDLDEATQEAVRMLASKGYLPITMGNFNPSEQYSKYDAAYALTGMTFLRNPDASADYIDLSEADPQYLAVASVSGAELNLYDDDNRRFNGISAVGLENGYAKPLELLAEMKEYDYPYRSNDPDLPYQSKYLSFPDVSYLKDESVDPVALGVRLGLINDGMTLFANENQFTRAEAALFLNSLSERFAETKGLSYLANDTFLSDKVRFKPSAPRKFKAPPIVKVYIGCFFVGLLGYIILKVLALTVKLKGKRRK